MSEKRCRRATQVEESHERKTEFGKIAMFE